MKILKKVVPLLIIILVIALVFTYVYFKSKKGYEITDSNKFKIEYESLNEVKADDGNNKYMRLSLDEKNPMEYATIEQILEIIDSGTGVIYFGKPECPWCRHILPVLFDAAKETKLKTIYYYNPEEIRKNDTNEYKQLVEKLKANLKTDTTTQKETDENFDANKKRIYVPDVYFIKEGKVISNHLSTVESHSDSKENMSEQQIQELKQIYVDNINKIYGKECNDIEPSC